MKRLLLLLPLACSLLFARPAGADDGSIRRFALVAGANDGGRGRALLRYATSDAAAVARVLEELGGVAPADSLLLVDPDRAALQRGLLAMHERLEAARRGGTRVELFVYYSGHSDEEGLLLGEERFGYDELRAALESLPADVRVAILDSCASGALTRRKGGVRRPPFLVDEASRVKGHAYLTSSSADEAAQESDRIGASFFTHYLVSGLRGAADTTRDGKVTLTEAYQFAFTETLARTEKTQSGAQHPAYEMQLVGTGDLVMTDLRSTSAGLVVDEAIAGRIFVRDASGALVVELRKAPAAPVELGLAPGAYVVTVEDRGTIAEASVTLTEGRHHRLAPQHLRAVDGERNRVRGDAPLDESEYVHAPFVLGVVPGTSTLPAATPEDRVVTGFGLNLIGGRTARLDGFEIGLGLNWHTDRASGAMFGMAGNLVEGGMNGAQLALGFNQAGGALDGLQGSVGYNGAAAGSRFAQLAVGANWSGGETSGVQASVGLNWSEGEMSGLQAATGVNLASEGFSGVQLSSYVNWSTGDARGLQATIGLNYAGGTTNGAQLGLINIASEGEGAQIGGYNWMGGRYEGLQLSYVGWARELSGAQIAVVNLGGTIDGAQIGVVNVATGAVSGTQIGVFNYADDVDAPIGLVSVVRKGRFHIDLWADETSAANVGIKLGARHVYGILGAGASIGQTWDGRQRWNTAIGLGTHIDADLPALSFVDIELLSRHVWYGSDWDSEGRDKFITTLRAGAGWQLLPRLALIAGPSLNLSVAENDRGGFGLFGSSVRLHDGDEVHVDLWPGFFAGVQF